MRLSNQEIGLFDLPRPFRPRRSTDPMPPSGLCAVTVAGVEALSAVWFRLRSKPTALCRCGTSSSWPSLERDRDRRALTGRKRARAR